MRNIFELVVLKQNFCVCKNEILNLSLDPNWMPVNSELNSLQTIEFDSTVRNITSCLLVCVYCLSQWYKFCQSRKGEKPVFNAFSFVRNHFVNERRGNARERNSPHICFVLLQGRCCGSKGETNIWCAVCSCVFVNCIGLSVNHTEKTRFLFKLRHKIIHDCFCLFS